MAMAACTLRVHA